MKIRRVRFTMRTLLLLPPAVVLLLFAVDRLTAEPSYWCYGATYEFDVVDARDKHSLKAKVTLDYLGPLDGQPFDGTSHKTSGVPYETYRGTTPNIGYAGICCTVWHIPRTLIFRRREMMVAEGVRFKIEAEGYEPFEFAPVDTKGQPLAFETWDFPVFRIELRPKGASEVPVSWSTRPELKVYHWPPPANRPLYGS